MIAAFLQLIEFIKTVYQTNVNGMGKKDVDSTIKPNYFGFDAKFFKHNGNQIRIDKIPNANTLILKRSGAGNGRMAYKHQTIHLGALQDVDQVDAIHFVKNCLTKYRSSAHR